MNKMLTSKHGNPAGRRSAGMTLLDILLAIVVFVVGMLALASLQGNLTRSSADANARTIGTNIAEELIENLRTIEDITLPAGYVCPTALDAIAADNNYQCIVDATATINRSGQVYSVTADVQDYYLMDDLVSITDDPSALPEDWNTGVSNFKAVELTVAWIGGDADRPGFQDAPDDNAHLGSGTFTVSSIIPSIPNIGSAKITDEPDDDEGTVVPYTPGQRPDIVAIDLKGSKFKESTKPQPDVVRTGQMAETWFDVITYNGQADSTFLRREEFLVITCECEMMAPDDSNQALMPTIWTGQSYSEEEWVTKPYGVSANNQQSFYCDTCCRDHHDISTNDPDRVYDPARLAGNRPNWSEDGGVGDDHKHYTRTNKGDLVLADVGDTYVEACRMVRKDGFMRVAQDFRQEGFVPFPEGFLDTPAGVAAYSDYVTVEVEDFYAGNQDRLDPPAAGEFPGDSALNATTLPFLGLNSQQMRARGIYVDRISAATQTMIDCINDKITTPDPDYPIPGDACGAPGVTDPLQILPFYDVQTTFLAWWDSNPPATPVEVSNEAVRDDNQHSRGLAELVDATANTTVEVSTFMHRGNIGLTVTDAITPSDDDLGTQAEGTGTVHVNVGTGGTPPPATSYMWIADFGSAVNKVEAADTIILEEGNEFCTRTNNMLRCVTPNDQAGSIVISGYTKIQGQDGIPLYICVNEPGGQNFFTVSTISADGISNSARLSWPPLNGVTFESPLISIEETPTGCN